MNNLEILNKYCVDKHGRSSNDLILDYIYTNELELILILIKEMMDLKDKENE